MREFNASFNRKFENSHTLDKQASTFCEENVGNDEFKILCEFGKLFSEHLLLKSDSSFTLPTFVPQLSQECKKEQPSISELEEEPHEVVTPIQLDENDLSNFNELVHQVECCYMHEITNEWEPSNIEPSVGSNELHENEWYKLEFLENKTILSLCDKFYLSPSIVFYKRFFSLEEISFFWYRDGYSECL